MQPKNLIATFVLSCFAVIVAILLVTAFSFNAKAVTRAAVQSYLDPVLGISIVKNPAVQIVWNNMTATFTVAVSYSGGVLLNNVSVQDPLAPNCNKSYSNASTGFNQSYTCTMGIGFVAGNRITNTIYVTGTATGQPAVTGSSNAFIEVIHPQVFIHLAPDPIISVTPGGSAIVNVGITNTGDITLTNMRVEYNVAIPTTVSSNCPRTSVDLPNAGTFAPREAFTYNCMLTTTANITETAFILDLRVRGDPPVPSSIPKLDYVARHDVRTVLVSQTPYPFHLWMPVVVNAQ